MFDGKFSRFDTIHQRDGDGQTYGHRTTAKTALCIASRAKSRPWLFWGRHIHNGAVDDSAKLFLEIVLILFSADLVGAYKLLLDVSLLSVIICYSPASSTADVIAFAASLLSSSHNPTPSLFLFLSFIE